MADRTSAEIARRVLQALDNAGASPEIVRDIWVLFDAYDFSPYQAGMDDLLRKYGICPICGRTGHSDPDCPEREDTASGGWTD